MTPVQDMVSVLFENETISKVKQQFKAGNQKISIDSRNMNFRLFKRNYGNINLELLCRDASGIYFKTIGYYEFEKGGFLSSGKLSVTILKEFEPDYKELKNSNKLDD